MTNNTIPTKRKTLLKLTTLVIICTLLFIILFEHYVVSIKLAEAKSLWTSKNTNHYEEVFHVAGFCNFPCVGDIKMEVNNNQVVNAMWRAGLIPDDPFNSVEQEKIVSGNLQSYTIDSLFQRATAALQQVGFMDVGGRITVDYDAGLGFISNFAINDCAGILGPQIGDCYWGVTVKSVELLD